MGQKQKTQTDHKELIELALCREDYEVLAQYHGQLLQTIIDAVDDDLSVSEIKRIVQRIATKWEVVSRCENAARYLISLKVD